MYLFDFDGTLADSMPTWAGKMIRILEEEGITPPENLIKIITPLGDRGTAEYYVNELGVKSSIESLIERMDKYAMEAYHNRVELKAGVLDFLKVSRAQGHKLAVLTASPHKFIDKCLERVGAFDLFEHVWSIEDFGDLKKNMPEIYVQAAEKMGATIGDVVFFDDNITALQTAKIAGMKTVGVYDATADDLQEIIKAETHGYVHSFKDVLPKIRTNLHTHTARCRHASDTEEEYVLRAIDAGLEVFGFSDHFPLAAENGKESSYRVPVGEVAEYVGTVNELKKKYAGQIEIHVGFEMEYYPSRFEEMLENAKKYGAEYLICGPHFIESEYIGGVYVNWKTSEDQILLAYTDRVLSAIRSGVFTYIAHPDLINYHGDEALFQECARKIGICAKENNVPLEINFLGIRDNRSYPNERFWQAFSGMDVPVVFGFDAHDAVNAADLASSVRANEMVKKFGLKLVEPVIRKI